MKAPLLLRITSLIAVTASIVGQSVKGETYTAFDNAGAFTWNGAPWSNGLPDATNIGLLKGGGVVTVDGSSTGTTTGGLLLGWTGAATLAITGGSLTVGDFASYGLAVGESALGTVNQTGGLVTAAVLRFNRGGGTGVYNLDGGTLAAGLVNKGAANPATFNFNGGTLQATASAANWFGETNGITVFVKSGGATIDTQAFDVGFLNNLFDGGGGGGLTKNGSGILTLNNADNTYTGATTVNAGTLIFKSGVATSSVSVSSNATVVYNSTVNESIVGISGAGNVEFQGSQEGFYSLDGTLTHSGTTTVNLTAGGSQPYFGTLFAQSANVLSANSVLNVLSGKVDLRGDQTIAGLTGSGGYITTDGVASTLTINAATGQTHTYFGVVGATPDAYNFPNVAVTKTGNGTQVFSGANTYTGGTTVTAGTLVLAHDSAAGTAGIALSGTSSATLRIDSGVTIANNITFSNTNAGSGVSRLVGNGSAYTVGTSGNLASAFVGGSPDTTASILAGTNSQGSTATLTMKFSDMSLASNDGMRISDVFSLSGTSTDIFVLQLNLTGLTPAAYLGWIDGGGLWANAVSGNTGAGGLAGAYTTSFATFLANNGGSFNAATMLGAYGVDTSGGAVWAVLNHNSDFAAVPEPATWMLAALGLTVTMIFRRRMA